MKISSAGLELIAQFEGFSATPYKDTGGKLTIGFGHLIRPSERFTSLTREQALNLLEVDAREAQNFINKHVTISLTQNQFDAICSFVFNIGSGAFQSSTFLKLLNKNDMVGAAAQMLKWIYVKKKVSKGLVNRRKYESEMLLKS